MDCAEAPALGRTDVRAQAILEVDDDIGNKIRFWTESNQSVFRNYLMDLI